MKPEKINKIPIDKTRKLIFLMIIVLCLIAIGIALYYQYYREEKLGIIFGINTKEELKEEEYNELKANFNSIFDNKLVNNSNGNYKKINENEDYVYCGYSNTEKSDNYTLNVNLPYINLNNNITYKYTTDINNIFKTKTEDIIAKNLNNNEVFSVSYKAYIVQDILSLVIKAELKEGKNSQRVLIQTYNYNIKENKEETLRDFLDLKGVTESEANKKIKQKIEEKKKQNEQLSELGYNMYVREYDEKIYGISNTTEFFIDEKGNLYLVYPYGNKDYTSEVDLVIF